MCAAFVLETRFLGAMIGSNKGVVTAFLCFDGWKAAFKVYFVYRVNVLYTHQQHKTSGFMLNNWSCGFQMLQWADTWSQLGLGFSQLRCRWVADMNMNVQCLVAIPSILLFVFNRPLFFVRVIVYAHWEVQHGTLMYVPKPHLLLVFNPCMAELIPLLFHYCFTISILLQKCGTFELVDLKLGTSCQRWLWYCSWGHSKLSVLVDVSPWLSVGGHLGECERVPRQGRGGKALQPPTTELCHCSPSLERPFLILYSALLAELLSCVSLWYVVDTVYCAPLLMVINLFSLLPLWWDGLQCKKCLIMLEGRCKVLLKAVLNVAPTHQAL